jgi:hypothetical protein
MENLEIYRKDNKIIIEIPVDEIVELQHNISEENEYYQNGLIYNEDAMITYIIDSLSEQTEDNGEYNNLKITKVESLILDTISNAACEDNDFITDNNEDDNYMVYDDCDCINCECGCGNCNDSIEEDDDDFLK